MTTTTVQTLRTHICKHWSRHARWDLRDGSTLILFQCDIEGPGAEEYGRGDILRSEKCLLGYDQDAWKTEPVIRPCMLLPDGGVVRYHTEHVLLARLVALASPISTWPKPSQKMWVRIVAAAQQVVEEYDAGLDSEMEEAL